MPYLGDVFDTCNSDGRVGYAQRTRNGCQQTVLPRSISFLKGIHAGYLLCYRPYPVVNIIVDEPIGASMTAGASGFLRHRGHGRTHTPGTSADVEAKATHAERMAQNMLLKRLAFIRVEPNRELGHKATVNR